MEEAKRVLQIAIAGNHNLLILGPIGYGKSLLANTSEDLITFETLFNSINHKDLINIFKIQNIASKENNLQQASTYKFEKKNLAAGIYYIQAYDENNVWKAKVVIK